MNKQTVSVAILGSGPLADLLAQRVNARKDLSLTACGPVDTTPAPSVACVLYLPHSNELADGTTTKRICDLLRSGFNVISTAPVESLDHPALISACREGASTFHGTGGFQSSLVSRFNRAFASITRNITDIELIEELDIGEIPAHPWRCCADVGLETTDPQQLAALAAATSGYYHAGLRTLSEAALTKAALSEAVFDNEDLDTSITSTATRTGNEQPPLLSRAAKKAEHHEQVIVRRTLGHHVAYDSVWTRRDKSPTPLRYRLNTTSRDAIGHVTITFHAEDSVHPADHLTCMGLLDAIDAVCNSKPGILKHDLDINHVKVDERLTG